MNFKKRVNGSWVDTPNYIHNTSTDTITTLPAEIYANDTTATVGLKGNMYQASGVSPTTPIQPQETGEKTGNLFDWNWLVNGYHLDPQTGLPTTHPSRVSILQPIDVSQLTTATISYESIDVETLYAMYSVLTTENTLIRRVTSVASGSTLDLSGGDKLYIAFYNGASSGATAITKDNITNIMLNLGSTALPYEPYGQYKIPISSAGQTTPIYLGEVQTTRRVKKLVLTGKEVFGKNSSSSTNYLYYADKTATLTGSISKTPVFCNELPVKTEPPISVIGINTNNNFSVVYFNFGAEIMNAQPSGNTVAGLKEYLAQQYAAGTPITVWYVLAESETAVVNEPLCKIGNYADTVSGITIPTIAGANTLSIGTTVQPSEVTVNYHGWHPVQNVHEAENGQWD